MFRTPAGRHSAALQENRDRAVALDPLTTACIGLARMDGTACLRVSAVLSFNVQRLKISLKSQVWRQTTARCTDTLIDNLSDKDRGRLLLHGGAAALSSIRWNS